MLLWLGPGSASWTWGKTMTCKVTMQTLPQEKTSTHTQIMQEHTDNAGNQSVRCCAGRKMREGRSAGVYAIPGPSFQGLLSLGRDWTKPLGSKGGLHRGGGFGMCSEESRSSVGKEGP